MKRLLLLPILCLMPAAAKAESVWLVVRCCGGFEKIEMRDLAQCEEMREVVRNKKKGPDWEHICLRGK